MSREGQAARPIKHRSSAGSILNCLCDYASINLATATSLRLSKILLKTSQLPILLILRCPLSFSSDAQAEITASCSLYACKEFLGELEQQAENGDELTQQWVCDVYSSACASTTNVSSYVSGLEVATVLVTIPRVTVHAFIMIDAILKAIYEVRECPGATVALYTCTSAMSIADRHKSKVCASGRKPFDPLDQCQISTMLRRFLHASCQFAAFSSIKCVQTWYTGGLRRLRYDCYI